MTEKEAVKDMVDEIDAWLSSQIDELEDTIKKDSDPATRVCDDADVDEIARDMRAQTDVLAKVRAFVATLK